MIFPWMPRGTLYLLFLSLVAFLSASGCDNTNAAPPAVSHKVDSKTGKILRVAPQRVPIIYVASGESQAQRTVTISAEVAGKILQRPVEVGDRVKRDALLFQVDDTFLHLNLRRLQASLSLQRARLENAQRNLRRERRLGKASTARLRDAAQLECDVAQRTMEMLRQEIAELQEKLRRCRVTAPFDAEIADLGKERGEFVSAASPLATLLDLSRIKVVVELPAAVVAKLQRNTIVKIIVPDLNLTCSAPIYRIHPQANSVTKKIPIEVRFDNLQHRIKSGVFVKLQFLLGHRRCLLVPSSYIRIAYNMYFVMAASGTAKEFRERVVQVEPYRDSWMIVKGVKSGDRLLEYHSGK